MVSAASPLAGDDGLGTPFGAPSGRCPCLQRTVRVGQPPGLPHSNGHPGISASISPISRIVSASATTTLW